MIRYRISTVSLILFMMVTGLHSQSGNLMVNADNKSAAAFFIDLSIQSGINIIYNDNLLEKLKPVTLHVKGVSVAEILDVILKDSNISYRYIGNQIVLFEIEPDPEKFTISGIITDSISGEPLISAYVYDEVSGKSTYTNDYGYYSLLLPEGDVQLLTGYLGYVTERLSIHLEKNQMIHLGLQVAGILRPVVVEADKRFDPANEIVPHAERVTFSRLQSKVQLGGASDLYRAADFIPGVHTGTDGVGGIHVRGGANDQNLILMDGVPVYHPNHLLGIISVFNYQVLQQASIYKANFPSKFSGRLSSVMDVRTREGNLNQWGFSGNIGASEVGVMVEGPLVQNKVGILLSGRFFLPGLFMRDFTRAYKERNGVSGYADIDYFDFNGKISWKASLRDRLYISMYRGNDRFIDSTVTIGNEVDRKTGIRIVSHESFDKNLNWANRTGVFRWNHILNDKVFTNLIVSTSSFVLQSVDRSEFNFTFPGTSVSPVSGFDTKEFKSSIRDITARLELDIRPSTDHQLSAGIYGIHYQLQPKSITINEASQVGDNLEEGLVDDAFFSAFKINSLEAGIYLEDKWEIKPGLQLSSGLHISSFFVQKIYYLDPQLRMTLDYQPFKKLAFNLGYSRMVQYLHNLTSSSIGLPTDLWVPTTSKVSPALSDQYVFNTLWKENESLSFALSAYLKDMRSLISYQEGASFLLKEGILEGSIVDAGNWESKITSGTGNASGIELQGIYEENKVRLKVNGTWSRSYRLFEEINNGEPYPDRYDRRWSSTFSGQYTVNSRLTCGVSFLYGSGVAITLAEAKFFNPGSFFPQVGLDYSKRNAYRLPDYHRLDISFTYLLGSKKRFNHSITLNLYNVYNRSNPFYVTLVENTNTQAFEPRQFSLFRFFPSVSYRFSLQ